jgi:2-polyprenyl-3-methyl-5-hydroxy-6-metoxy-1,4-benzoquinol methylase/glycosyltransferase involved in cell wall biosynthesis
MSARSKESTSPRCILCDHADTKLVSRVGIPAVWRCPSCITDFVFPPPSEELFVSPVRHGYGIEWASEFLARFERESETLSLLDVGCGDGSRLGTAHDRGWKCFGVEPSETDRAAAQRRIGTVAFLTDRVEHLIPHVFDVILILDVLEHCPDPMRLFYALFARGAIQPETTVVISTPIARALDSFPSLVDNESARFVSFSAKSLKLMLSKLRFSHVEISGPHRLIGETARTSWDESSESDVESDRTDIAAVVSGSDFHSFMKERYVPGTWSELALYEHFPRYLLAGRLAFQKTVLDLGCGTGYGTAMLAGAGAASVIGLDIDQSTIEWAQRAHHEKNLSFCARTDLGAGFAPESFDLITCFEMIEHVTEPIQRATIASIARLLKKDGILLISTPNPAVTRLYGENPFHLREMIKEEFVGLLREHFQHIQLNYQFIRAGALITPGMDVPAINARVEALDDNVKTSPPAAFIAICSNGQLPDPPVIDFVDKADLVASKMRTEHYINRLQLEHFKAFEGAAAKSVALEQQTQEVRKLNRTLAEKDILLRTAGEEIERRGEEIERRGEEIERRGEEIERHWAEIERLSLAVDELNSRNQQLDHLLTVTVANLRSLEASSLVRLERAIREDRWSLRKVAKIASILKSIAKNQFQTSFFSRTRKNDSTSQAAPLEETNPGVTKTLAAYQVKQPGLRPRAEERPRILYALANFMTGGSSRLVVDLIEHLGDQYDQEVITSFIPSPPAYEGLRIAEFRSKNSPYPILEHMRTFRPDIVHVHYWGECDEPWYRQVFAAAERFGCQIIQNVNTPIAPFVAPVFRNVYVSDYVFQTFAPGDRRGMVIYPGSDLELFNRKNLDDIPDDCIGMVYRLENDKLDLHAIEPFVKAVRRRPQTRVLIVGGGTFQEPYMQAVREAGVEQAFEFTGYVPYELLPDIFRQLSIFVAPVWKESFGQVGVFAMNMGIPVVGYNVGAITEMIEDPTLVAPPADSDKLADIITHLLDDRAERLAIGPKNRKRANLLFSIEAMIESYRKLYHEADESRKKR